MGKNNKLKSRNCGKKIKRKKALEVKVAELERKSRWQIAIILGLLLVAGHGVFTTFLTWYISNWGWIEPLYTIVVLLLGRQWLIKTGSK